MSAPQAPPIESPPVVEEQAPVPEPDETPQIDLGESESEETEEQPETQGEDEKPDPISVLQQTIDKLSGQIEELKSRPQTDPQTIEANVRERTRMESEQRDERERQTKADQREVEVSLRAELIAGGVPSDLIDPSILRQASEGVINRRYGQIVAHEVTGPVSEALQWVRAVAENPDNVSRPISGKARAFAVNFADDFNAIFGKLRTQAQDTADLSHLKDEELVKRLSPAQIKAIHAHESGRLGAQTRNGTKPLKRPDATTPTPNDNSTIADRLDRVGTSRETPADRQWWNAREKARGRG